MVPKTAGTITRTGPGYVTSSIFAAFIACAVNVGFPMAMPIFCVDHTVPQSAAPERICDYDNLVYACCQCNAAKHDVLGVLAPCSEPFGRHLTVRHDGTINNPTPEPYHQLFRTPTP